jgi:hypothetical protein
MVDDIAGMKVWDSLLQIIQQESVLPGRKTVLYLSDGLLTRPAVTISYRRSSAPPIAAT